MSEQGAVIIDGRAVSRRMRDALTEQVKALPEGARRPGLAVIRVGDDPASEVYVRQKKRAAIDAGFHFEEHYMPASTTQAELLDRVNQLNRDDAIDGFLVQLPLPDGLDETEVIRTIDPAKDVDGFHPENVGALWSGLPGMVPCTPAGVMKLIETLDYDLTGKHAVVVGRSNIVGKPVAALLLARHATVTICHSRTQNLADVCRSADVLVAAVGRPRLIQGDWVKPGAVVIDVGINREPDGSLVGDVDFEAAKERAGYITPVPGGVGPMTIAMLLENTFHAYQRREGSR